MKHVIEVIGIALFINALAFAVAWLMSNLEINAHNFTLIMSVFLLGWSGGCLLTHAYYKMYGDSK